MKNGIFLIAFLLLFGCSQKNNETQQSTDASSETVLENSQNVLDKEIDVKTFDEDIKEIEEMKVYDSLVVAGLRFTIGMGHAALDMDTVDFNMTYRQMLDTMQKTMDDERAAFE